MRALLATAFLCLSFIFPAKAVDITHPTNPWAQEWSAPSPYQKRVRTQKVRHLRHVSRTSAAVIAHRPAGCTRAYCGCALSLKNFGKIIPSLNIAANWKGFPIAMPAPDMVAARTGHVFQLIAHVSGNVWKVYDPNSGRGATRIHERSIAGYTIHNPRGNLMAYNGRPGRHVRRVRYARAR